IIGVVVGLRFSESGRTLYLLESTRSPGVTRGLSPGADDKRPGTSAANSRDWAFSLESEAMRSEPVRVHEPKLDEMRNSADRGIFEILGTPRDKDVTIACGVLLNRWHLMPVTGQRPEA